MTKTYDIPEAEQLLSAIHAKTDNRPEQFLELLEQRAKEISPDYPYEGSNAFDWLWAIVASCTGISAANQSCHAFIKHLGDKLGMDNQQLYQEFGKFMEGRLNRDNN